VLPSVSAVRLFLFLLFAGGMFVASSRAESSEAQPSPTPHHLHKKKHPNPDPKGKGGTHSGHVKKIHHHHAVTHDAEHTSVPPIHSGDTGESSDSAIHSHGSSKSSSSATSEAPAQIPPQPPPPPPRIPSIASPGGVPTVSTTVPSPPSLPHGANPSAPITIEKSGAEPDQGIEPAPTPEASGGFFGWLFGGGGSGHSYTYLNASTRAAIDHAPVRHGRWKYIIVHNSGTREGNARVFNIYHLRVRHMKNGLAYHFVIGDGHGSGDGQIEIGHRWTAQLNGGHVASDYLNDISLGICLVGDFNRDLPTQAQIGALEELIDYLRIRVGKTQGHRAIVYAHKEINPRPTDCPGDRFPYSWLHGKFR
jgi:hypothetical protein